MIRELQKEKFILKFPDYRGYYLPLRDSLLGDDLPNNHQDIIGSVEITSGSILKDNYDSSSLDLGLDSHNMANITYVIYAKEINNRKATNNKDILDLEFKILELEEECNALKKRLNPSNNLPLLDTKKPLDKDILDLELDMIVHEEEIKSLQRSVKKINYYINSLLLFTILEIIIMFFLLNNDFNLNLNDILGLGILVNICMSLVLYLYIW